MKLWHFFTRFYCLLIFNYFNSYFYYLILHRYVQLRNKIELIQQMILLFPSLKISSSSRCDFCRVLQSSPSFVGPISGFVSKLVIADYCSEHNQPCIVASVMPISWESRSMSFSQLFSTFSEMLRLNKLIIY